MALTGARCQTLHAATGFTNESVRGLIARLLGSDCHANQMTYNRLLVPLTAADQP